MTKHQAEAARLRRVYNANSGKAAVVALTPDVVHTIERLESVSILRDNAALFSEADALVSKMLEAKE